MSIRNFRPRRLRSRFATWYGNVTCLAPCITSQKSPLKSGTQAPFNNRRNSLVGMTSEESILRDGNIARSAVDSKCLSDFFRSKGRATLQAWVVRPLIVCVAIAGPSAKNAREVTHYQLTSTRALASSSALVSTQSVPPQRISCSRSSYLLSLRSTRAWILRQSGRVPAQSSLSTAPYEIFSADVW